MNNWQTAIPVLAQAQPEPAKGPAGGGDGFGGLGSMMLPLLMIGFVFYFLIFRPQQRERKAREAMLAQLKKNDRVATIGGIIGQVVSISPDEKEVVLKVDDNTRIRFRRSAIQTVLTEGEAAEDQPKISS